MREKGWRRRKKKVISACTVSTNQDRITNEVRHKDISCWNSICDRSSQILPWNKAEIPSTIPACARNECFWSFFRFWTSTWISEQTYNIAVNLFSKKPLLLHIEQIKSRSTHWRRVILFCGVRLYSKWMVWIIVLNTGVELWGFFHERKVGGGDPLDGHTHTHTNRLNWVS